MDESVNAIEVKLVPDGQDEGKDSEPNGMRRKGAPWAIAIGITPQAQDFISRPDRHACRKSANDVVDVLALEHEHIAGVFRWPLAVIFELCALASLHIEVQFQQPVDDQNQNTVAREQINDPARRKGLHRFDTGRKPKPYHTGQSHEQHVPWEEIARQPFEKI